VIDQDRDVGRNVDDVARRVIPVDVAIDQDCDVGSITSPVINRDHGVDRNVSGEKPLLKEGVVGRAADKNSSSGVVGGVACWVSS